MRRDLPSGTVTFLFTDIEGSTRLLHELGADAYSEALAEHRHVLRDAFAANGGETGRGLDLASALELAEAHARSDRPAG